MIALLGIGGLARLARRRGRDQQHLGLIPGLTPTGAAVGSTTGRDRRAPVAVQVTPPAGVRPASWAR